MGLLGSQRDRPPLGRQGTRGPVDDVEQIVDIAG
jgi:hypothetical protein